jgi:hypothetical protein
MMLSPFSSITSMTPMSRAVAARAEQTSKNLLQVIERDIARNVEIIDLSLQGVVDNLKPTGRVGVRIDDAVAVLVDHQHDPHVAGGRGAIEQSDAAQGRTGPVPVRPCAASLCSIAPRPPATWGSCW